MTRQLFSSLALSLASASVIWLGSTVRLAARAVEPSPLVIPADAAMVVNFSTQLEQWQALRRFHVVRFITQEVMDGLRMLPQEIKPEQEILPWLGQQGTLVLLAAREKMSIDDASKRGLVIVAVRDEDRFNAFEQKLRKDSVDPVIERRYQGVRLVEVISSTTDGCEQLINPAQPTAPQAADSGLSTPQPSTTPLSESDRDQCITGVMAELPGHRVFGQSSKAMREFLDAQSVPTDTPALRQAAQNPLIRQSLVSYYLDLAQLVNWLKLTQPEAESGTESSPPEPPVPVSPSPSAPAGASPKELWQTWLKGEPLSQKPAPPSTNAPPSPPVAPPLGEAIPDPEEPDSPELPDSLDPRKILEQMLVEYRAIDGYFWVEPEGMRFQVGFQRQKPRPEWADVAKPEDDRILSVMPASTYLSASSRNPKQQWQRVLETGTQDKDFQTALGFLRTALKSVDLDLEKDILNWMDGEYAVFLFPSQRSVLARLDRSQQFGLGLAMQTSDRAAAQRLLDKLTKLMRENIGRTFDTSSHTINGRDIQSWDVVEGKQRYSAIAYTWRNDNTLIVSTGIGSLQDLDRLPSQLLPASATFRSATASLPKPNQGYFYMNWGAILAWFNPYIGFFALGNDPELQLGLKILQMVHSVAVSSSATADREQIDLFIGLAPIRRNQEASLRRGGASASDPSP